MLPPRPEPTDDVHAVTIGTVAWGLAALALLPFWDDLVAADRGWWLWTCAAGVGLGLFGVDYCRRRAVGARAVFPAGATPGATPAATAPDPATNPTGGPAELPGEPPSSHEAPPATPQHR